MKSKKVKVKSELFQMEYTVKISERLNRLKGIDQAPHKTAEANKAVPKIKEYFNM